MCFLLTCLALDDDTDDDDNDIVLRMLFNGGACFVMHVTVTFSPTDLQTMINEYSTDRIYAGDLSTATKTVKGVAGLVQKISASDVELVNVAKVRQLAVRVETLRNYIISHLSAWSGSMNLLKKERL